MDITVPDDAAVIIVTPDGWLRLEVPDGQQDAPHVINLVCALLHADPAALRQKIREADETGDV